MPDLVKLKADNIRRPEYEAGVPAWFAPVANRLAAAKGRYQAVS